MPEAMEQMGVQAVFDVTHFRRGADAYSNVIKRLSAESTTYGKTVEAATSGANRAWKDTGNTAKQTSQTWKDFSGSMIGQVYQIKAALDAGRFAVNAFLGPFKQFIALGTEAVGLRRTRDLFIQMVGGVEEYEAAITRMREATKGTIKDTELINNAFLMMRRGYADTADSAALLARNISLTAKAAGQVPSPEAAMQVFSLMMSNQSRMRVDAFGLTIEQVDNRIEHLKETLGATEEEAFRLAIIELLNEQVEQLGLTAETSVTKLDRMRAQLGNMADEIKSLVGPYFDDFVNIVTKGANIIKVNMDVVRDAFHGIVGTIRGVAAQFGEFFQGQVFGLMALKEAVSGNIEEAKRYGELALQSYKRVLTVQPFFEALHHELERGVIQVAETTEDSAAAQVAALAEVEQAWKDLQEAVKAYEDDLSGVYQQMSLQMQKDMSKAFYAVQDAAIAAARRREDIARQTAANIQKIEQSLAAAIAQAAASYHTAIENAQNQHADARIRIEQDYQRRLRDIQRRFDMQIDDAIAERDATAILRLQRQRDLELTEAREQRDEQSAEADKQYNDQKATAERAYRDQIAAAQAAYKQQMDALAQSLREQEEEYQRAQQRREEDEQRAREREEGLRRQAWGQKISEIYLNHKTELDETTNHYNNLKAQVRSYYDTVLAYYTAIGQVTGQTYTSHGRFPIPAPRQHGGYMQEGLYRVGERGREFALSNQTTRALENALGGALTQANVARLANQRAGSTMTVNHNVTGGIAGAIQVAVSEGISGMEGRIKAQLSSELSEFFRVTGYGNM